MLGHGIGVQKRVPSATQSWPFVEDGSISVSQGETVMFPLVGSPDILFFQIEEDGTPNMGALINISTLIYLTSEVTPGTYFVTVKGYNGAQYSNIATITITIT